MERAEEEPRKVCEPPLACSVRGCAEPLQRAGRAFVCARGHSYDIGRSGYVNLLQPQDRKSLDAGDARSAVEARANLIAAGVGRALVDAVIARVEPLLPASNPVVVDLGAGSGEVLGGLAQRRAICGVGIDLSAAAVTHASRRFPAVRWVVANADRRVPLLDHRADVVLSVHGRRNVDECVRVLRPDGFLLVAVPAADDLIELRSAVQGGSVARDRTAALIEEHARAFGVVERSTVRVRHDLDRPALLELLRGTYRGVRASTAPRVDTLERMTVTLASDLVLFTPAASPR
jgi:23S rRNA (guanine745-N1)-methyltransferase